ncbi:MAG TPA: DUF427 domain-containing protein [Solirubrobacteraceae bacterium]|nr:DUF427 domain-containing protein [Solirubrobacteraceae bacterium]
MAQRREIGPGAQLRYEPSSRWVRGELGGETVVDSREPLLVWEPGRIVPLYCFPRRDVRMELLRPATSAERSDSPRDRLWTAEVDGRVEDSAAWSYADPDLADYVALRWDALDAWYEEDEEVFGHPRDPHHRIDVLPSSRRVRVELEGELLAESAHPHLLFETGLPIRFYLAEDDIRADLVGPSETHTRCPYKGVASYWSVRVADQLLEDLAWFYPDPVPEAPKIRGLIAFYNERVDLIVDGRPHDRPHTQWSRSK